MNSFPIFANILPISLQQIAFEKNHAMQSNELAKGYTLIPVSDQFHRQILAGNAYIEIPLFLKYEGAFSQYSLVCALFHTQGSKTNCKSNKSLMQKLKQECNAKIKLF